MEKLLFDILRQGAAFRQLSHDIDVGFGHAYLFLSDDTVALDEFLTLVECRVYCPKLCLCCNECRKVLNKSKPDIRELNSDGQPVDVATLRFLTDDVLLSAMEGGEKLYILRNLQQFSEKVQNKLLKTLEEPPAGVHLLLTAGSLQGILPTVVSRVKQITLAPFSSNQLAQLLKSKNIEGYQELARCAQGSATTALRLASEDFFEKAEQLARIYCDINGSADVPRFLLNKVFTTGLLEALYISERIFQDVLFVLSGLPNEVMLEGFLPVYSQLASHLNQTAVAAIMTEINISEQKLGANCSVTGVTDCLLLKVAEEKAKCKQLSV